MKYIKFLFVLNKQHKIPAIVLRRHDRHCFFFNVSRSSRIYSFLTLLFLTCHIPRRRVYTPGILPILKIFLHLTSKYLPLDFVVLCCHSAQCLSVTQIRWEDDGTRGKMRRVVNSNWNGKMSVRR